MGQINLSFYELIMYLALLGVVLGILLGLIPLILGLKRNKRSYGLFGLVTSIIAGIFSPILSVIAVAIFTWLILRKTKSEHETAVRDVVVNETPVDVKVENSELR